MYLIDINNVKKRENQMKTRLIRKAMQSRCRFMVSAVGFDEKGNIVGFSCNKPNITRKGGSIHAELALMNQYGKVLKTIIICRTNKTGTSLLPIRPCNACANRAERLRIKIVTITN